MIKKVIHSVLPIFIGLYFILAFAPIFVFHSQEIFPFFSFKLYSKIPNGFERYDLLLNRGDVDESFLIFKNTSLNSLEQKSFSAKVASLRDENGQGIQHDMADLLSCGRTIHLVKISGNYINAVRDDYYLLEVVRRLK